MYNKILKSLKVKKLGNLEFPNYKKKKKSHPLYKPHRTHVTRHLALWVVPLFTSITSHAHGARNTCPARSLG